MKWNKLETFIFLFIVFINLHSLIYGTSYILCIEGGGTKTVLQVMNQKGHLITLIKNGVETEKIEVLGSNINVIGLEKVETILFNLIEETKIDGDGFLTDHLSNCQIVAGMAGAGLLKNKELISSIFEKWGLATDRIHVMSDADLALSLLDNEGIILISGTGSVCFGKKGTTHFRVGGLGKILGDEGSGYQIGLEALKYALADEYGWGTATNLTSQLKTFFNVPELKILIPSINLGKITSSEIASCAHLVFEKAFEQDTIAKNIIDQAAKNLRNLLIMQLKISKLSNCELHLWGGIFKNLQVDDFIQKIIDCEIIKSKQLKIDNYSNKNSAVLFARKFLID